MSTGRRLLATTAFGLAVLFVVVVVVFGFPTLWGDDDSSSAYRPCQPRAQDVLLPFGLESAAGRWERHAPFPIAQDELRAEVVGDTVYVGTGLVHAGANLVSTNVLVAFDPERSTYRRLPGLPRRIDHAGLVAAGGELYLIGGFRDWRPTAEVWKLSPDTGAWTELAPMEVPRGSPAAAAIGGKIYVAGGAAGQDAREPTGVVEVFDLATGRWTRGPEMPTARHHAGAAAVGGQLYVVGGRGRRDLSLDVVERLDPQSGQWQALPPLPLGAGGLAVVAAGGRVIAISGGDDGGEGWVTPATWAFDPASSRWQRLADLQTPRHGHAAAAFGGKLYVFGGAPCPDYGLTDSVESLEL
ncbi:MAG TPA: DUF1668 domain-containing protein [Gaiellaceae bacterium]|nr:DUF1668 domain-containing protein [Gaiellaceae bacterium]